MTQNPYFYADPPDVPLAVDRADVLSETISAVALRGVGVSRWGPPAPCRVEVPATSAVVHLAECPLLVSGPGLAEVELAAGDLVLMAHGGEHLIATPGSTSQPRALRAADMFAPGSGAPPRWLTGTYRATDAAAGLLAELPPAVVVRAAAGHAWQPLATSLLVAEIAPNRPGASVMISRILDLLLIHALREWSSSSPVGGGPLAAALDVRLAPALEAIHRRPEHRWTVADLARVTSQSRTSFAEHFRRKVGMSPASYLAARRLMVAADKLRSTSAPIAEIAHSVGYESEAAFSRAFRRRYGCPPRDYRVPRDTDR